MTFNCEQLRIIPRPGSHVSVYCLYITKFKLLFCFNNVFRLPLGISSIHKDVNWRTRKVFGGLDDLQLFFGRVRNIYLAYERILVPHLLRENL